jgi:hypothetical protein
MAVTLIHRRIGTEKIEVLVALGIPDPDAVTLGQDHVQWMVIMGSEPVFDLHELLRRHVFSSCMVWIIFLIEIKKMPVKKTGYFSEIKIPWMLGYKLHE